VLAVTTGLQQGELLGLRWEDVDLERGRCTSGALTRVRGKVTLGPPKTLNSRRSVKLTTVSVAALQEHLSRQMEEMERMSSLYRPGGLVFATQRGTLVNPENLVKRSFKPLLSRAGLPEIRFHDLRHTCATLLLGRGMHPKLVQELLGPATIAMTLDTYSHYLPSMGDQAASAMGDVLG
jgi:integrase